MMACTYRWMLTLTVFLMVGCAASSTPPVYYNLNAVATSSNPGYRTMLTVGIGPLELPDYLDRSAIVTRLSPNRLQINNGHRWAGSLQKEILRVLAENIRNETTAHQVVVYPWRNDIEPAVRFRVAIQSFEGRPSHQVQLKATWSMHQHNSDRMTLMRDSEIIETVAGRNFESLTQSMGRALAILSREMVNAMAAEGLVVKREKKKEN